MGKIFYLMGKSASGKDTIYKKVKEQLPELKTIVIYTTRPIREGEQDGVEYFFVDDGRLQELQQAGRLLSCESTILFTESGSTSQRTMVSLTEKII